MRKHGGYFSIVPELQFTFNWHILAGKSLEHGNMIVGGKELNARWDRAIGGFVCSLVM